MLLNLYSYPPCRWLDENVSLYSEEPASYPPCRWLDEQSELSAKDTPSYLSAVQAALVPPTLNRHRQILIRRAGGFSCRRITVICLNRPLGGLMIRKLHENISKSLIRPEGGLMKKERTPRPAMSLSAL